MSFERKNEKKAEALDPADEKRNVNTPPFFIEEESEAHPPHYEEEEYKKDKNLVAPPSYGEESAPIPTIAPPRLRRRT